MEDSDLNQRNLKYFVFSLFGFLILAMLIFIALFQLFDLKASFLEFIKLLNLRDLAVLLGMGAIIYIADAIRFIIFSNLFYHKISFNKALNCVFANFFFSWLTPGASMGAPASAYIMHLDGLNLTKAMSICLFKGITGICSFIALAFGISYFYPSLFSHTPGFLILLNSTFFLYLMFVAPPLVLFLFKNKLNELYNKPIKFKFVVKIIEVAKMISELKIRGIFPLIVAFISHFVFLFLFLLPGIWIYLKFDPNLHSAFVKNFLFFVFSVVSPTPGGIGLSEASSLYFYKDPIGVHAAILVAMAFRLFTFYLQIIIGIVYLYFTHQKKLINYVTAKLFKA